MVKKTVPKAPIYQIKVTLDESKPPIWQRISNASALPFGLMPLLYQMVRSYNNTKANMGNTEG